ncbi:MAG: competence/damage-inducible protein A [Candidatus Limnocylindrales bacterium]
MTDAATGTIVGAALLSIGTELTVGETRDTNAGELARDLTTEGVRVIRITTLPDELTAVTEAFADGLVRADLVVSTGGLGPTPDDLTRESIAAVFDERPALDPSLERWLRNLWERRGLPFAEINLKQAWLIPSATPIPNGNGTAPGWWVDRPDGRIVVALPGPPREMRPMWRDWVLPRLRDRGLGLDAASLTYRLTGIGESAAADLLGEDLLRSPNPIVATYARADAVDVRISATAEPDRSAADLVGRAAERVRAAIGPYIWATGADTWGEAVGEALTARGWTLATWECGTGGSLVGLLGDVPGLVTATVVGPGSAATGDDPRRAAERLRAECGATIVLAVRAAERGADTVVSVAVATGRGIHRERRVAFLGGPLGRSRAALTAVAILHERLREVSGGPSGRALRGRG